MFLSVQLMASVVSGTQQSIAEILNSAKHSQQGLDPYKSEPELLGPHHISARQLAIFSWVLAGTRGLWLSYFAFCPQTFLEYSDTGAKFVFGDKYKDHFFAFKVRWLLYTVCSRQTMVRGTVQLGKKIILSCDTYVVIREINRQIIPYYVAF